MYNVTLLDPFRCNESAEATSVSVLTIEEGQMMSLGKVTNI